MSLSNISGTTMPTFRIAADGVVLMSKAIKDADGNIRKVLQIQETVINQTTGQTEIVKKNIAVYNTQIDDKGNEILPGASTNDLYDVVVKSSDIASMSYTNNTVKFKLRNGLEFSLDKMISTSDIVTPETATEGEIVLFGSKSSGDTKTTLNGSGVFITDNFEDIDTKDKVIPTAKAFKDYLNDSVSSLASRMDGDGVVQTTSS